MKKKKESATATYDKTLFLIRHAQSTKNLARSKQGKLFFVKELKHWKDAKDGYPAAPLSVIGKKQMKEFKKSDYYNKFSKAPKPAVYTSRLQRCQDTAAGVREFEGGEDIPIIDERLGEAGMKRTAHTIAAQVKKYEELAEEAVEGSVIVGNSFLICKWLRENEQTDIESSMSPLTSILSTNSESDSAHDYSLRPSKVSSIGNPLSGGHGRAGWWQNTGHKAARTLSKTTKNSIDCGKKDFRMFNAELIKIGRNRTTRKWEVVELLWRPRTRARNNKSYLKQLKDPLVTLG